MDKLTYRQAYDKIIEAYFKDEIKPIDPQFCFCGTLSPDMEWGSRYSRRSPLGEFYPYSVDEYERMEMALFSAFPDFIWAPNLCTQYYGCIENPEDYIRQNEDLLFKGMSAALDVLKQIHRERGENVDEDMPAFTKRELTKVH